MLQQTEAPIAENEFRKTLAQLLGGLLILVGLFASFAQLQLSRQELTDTIERGRRQLELLEAGQATDRFSAAVAHLGSDEVTLRLGGVYLLERIGRDSPEDLPAVMRLLNTFVRENALDLDAVMRMMPDDEPRWPTLREYEAFRAKLQPDFFEAVDAIGRLANLDNSQDQPTLDFKELIIDGAEFEGAHLTGLEATGALFCGGDFTKAHLEQANLSFAGAVSVNFEGANLTNSSLVYAQWILVNLKGADLTGTDLTGSTIAADLSGANLRFAKGLTEAMLEGSCSDGGTLLPEGIKQLPDCEDYYTHEDGPPFCLDFWPVLLG